MDIIQILEALESLDTEHQLSLEEALCRVRPLNRSAMDRAQERWDSIAKPLHGLGLLEEAVVKISGMGSSTQVLMEKKCVVVFCADNGVVEEGVTQADKEVTAIVTQNLTIGATSVCCMARKAGATVIPVDMGVARELGIPGLLRHRLGCGTNNISKDPAMTMEQAVDGLEYGINLAGRLKAQGYRLIATGEMGIGNTTTSSAVAAVLLCLPVEQVTGRGAGLTSVGLGKKVDAIKQAIEINKPDPQNPLDVLAKLGGFDIAGMVGLFLGGAVHKVPIVVDGFISAVSALIAMRLCPEAQGYWLCSHVSKEPASQLVLEALGLKPFITCELCLGEGTGAVACFPLLDMALAVYNEMSTFSDIKIEEYKPLN